MSSLIFVHAENWQFTTTLFQKSALNDIAACLLCRFVLAYSSLFIFLFFMTKRFHVQKTLMSKKPTNKTKISAQFCIKAWKVLRRWKSFVLRWVLFLHVKSFCVKINRFEIVSITSIHYTTLYYSSQLPHRASITYTFFETICENGSFILYEDLFESFFICENLFFFVRIFLNFLLFMRTLLYLWESFLIVLIFLNFYHLCRSFFLFESL